MGDLKRHQVSLVEPAHAAAAEKLDAARKRGALEGELTDDALAARKLLIGDETRTRAALDATRNLDMRSRTDVFCIGNFQGGGQPFGKVAELRIWGVALSAEEVEINSRTILSGNEPGLLAYYPFNGDARSHAAAGGFDGDNVGGLAEPWGCAAPIGHPEPGAFDQPPVPRDAVVSAEYASYGVDPASGQRNAMMRRFIATPTAGGITLLMHKRIEALALRWIGNTQFKPTLLGYIEGAPPVPSENLTLDPASYNGATSVELATEEAVSYAWSREDTDQRGDSLGGFGALAWAFEGSLLGIKGFQTEGVVGFQGQRDTRSTTSNSTSVTATAGRSVTDRLALRGHAEADAKFPRLGRRFIPKNVGYALVVSALADVFVTRLARSQRMVAYEVRPVQDIPPDVNTITFLINPAYTMNGSLDGLTGSLPTSERYFPQVVQMRAQYGAQFPASDYRLHDAYARKAAIDKREQEREAYFASFQVNPAAFAGKLDAQPTAATDQDAAQADTEKQLEKLKFLVDVQGLLHSAAAKAVWQKKMQRHLENVGKRNIVNSVVWDADGGLHAESQQFASTVEHTIGGAYEADFDAGLHTEGLATVGVGVAWSLTFTQSQRMSQTLSKTESNSQGFALNVDLSGVEHQGITDFKDRPFVPGEKVDRYRFMSFYLEGDTSHFHDFFNAAVDPEWLAGNDEEARALRQVDRSKANKTWRALHRVTDVERPALAGFGTDPRGLVETPTPVSELADLKAAVSGLKQENRQLQRKLDQILARLPAVAPASLVPAKD